MTDIHHYDGVTVDLNRDPPRFRDDDSAKTRHYAAVWHYLTARQVTRLLGKKEANPADYGLPWPREPDGRLRPRST